MCLAIVAIESTAVRPRGGNDKGDTLRVMGSVASDGQDVRPLVRRVSISDFRFAGAPEEDL